LTGVGAFLLERFEFGDGFVELVGEAALLQSDVVEVFLVRQVDVAEQCAFALLGIFFVGD
jgi:hypothetical protein